MDIISALKEKEIYGIRVSYEDKWLIWDGGYWIVYQRKYHAKKSRVLCMSKSQEEAVKVLLEE